MYFCSSARSTLWILSETLKIFCNNKKIFSFITIITLVTYSVLNLSNTFSTESLLINVIKESSILDGSRDSSEYSKILLTGFGHDLISLIGIESIFLLVTFIVSKFSMTAIIIAADITYRKKPLSLRDVLSSATKSFIRPLITSFYVNLFGIVYAFFVTFFVMAILVCIQLIYYPSAQLPQAVAIVLAIPALVFYAYLAIIWSFGVVISAIEEGCYGVDALRKASKLLKGMKRQWFALHLLYILIVIFVSDSFGYLSIKSYSQVTQTFIMLVKINSVSLATVVSWVASAVFYYRCKKINGDEIESQENISYSKLPTHHLSVVI